MLINRKSLGILGIGILLTTATVGVFMSQRSASQASPARVYSVKFVCGVQPIVTTPGEPPVKPGNYATDINIHNFKNSTTSVKITKKTIVLVRGTTVRREPTVTAPAGITESVSLPTRNATMDDCNKIAQLAGIPLATPQTLFIGFLQIDSSDEVAVTAVYTAEVPGPVGAAPTGISQSVERIEGEIP
jgi:hypothetical protein